MSKRKDFRRPVCQLSYADVVLGGAFGWYWAGGTAGFFGGLIIGALIACIQYFNNTHLTPWIKWKKAAEGDGDPTATLADDRFKDRYVSLVASRFGEHTADHWVIYESRRWWPGPAKTKGAS